MGEEQVASWSGLMTKVASFLLSAAISFQHLTDLASGTAPLRQLTRAHHPEGPTVTTDIWVVAQVSAPFDLSFAWLAELSILPLPC